MGAAPPLLGCIILASGASVAFGAGPTLARFGLPDRAALAAALTSALLLPATALMAAHLLTAAPIGLPQLPISLSALTERLSEIVFLPALLAFAMRASIPGWISDHRGDCRGVVVAMLILVALARGNVLDHGFAVGARLLWTVALAFGVSVIWATAGWLTLRPFGRAAGMVGCVCGGRKAVPFVWAAVADVLPPESQLFMVMLVFPVCLLPVILAWAERFGWFGAAALKRQSGNPAAATEQTESIPAQARRPAARPG